MKQSKWSPTDRNHYEGKTLRQLQDMLVRAEQFMKDHPQFQFGWANEYRCELTRRIADMIGRKQK